MSQPVQPWVDLVRMQQGDGLAEALHRFCARAKELLPALGVSVTILVDGQYVTGGASDDIALELDQRQYDLAQGPCVSAAEEQTAMEARDMALAARWPLWRPEAVARGIGSMLSLPLGGVNGRRGGLNLYGEDVGSFDGDELKADVEALRLHAQVLLDNADLYANASAQAEQLKTAMASRGIIEQAKGVLVARERIDPDTAWDFLVRMSQRSHRKLKDIAQDVVNRASSGTLG